MANFISNIFTIYTTSFGRIFSTSYHTIILMLFCIVLLTAVFKFVVRRKG